MINPLLSLIGALSVLIPEASSSFSGMQKVWQGKYREEFNAYKRSNL